MTSSEFMVNAHVISERILIAVHFMTDGALDLRVVGVLIPNVSFETCSGAKSSVTQGTLDTLHLHGAGV